jgi:hypothetical protein
MPQRNQYIPPLHKQEIHRQAHSKKQYQHDLATAIIDRQYRHISPEHLLSNKLERDDLTEKKLKYIKEAKVRSNLFTMLQYEINEFTDPRSIKCNILTRVDVTIDGHLTHLTTKIDIEDQSLTRNPHANLASGTNPFGHTVLGGSLGTTCDSPLADSILDGFSLTQITQ